MLRISIAAVAALALASQALAADAPALPEAVVTTSSSTDWSGFYAGVVGTAGVVTSTHDDVGYWMHGATLDQDFGAYGIGGTAGFNLQSGSIVYGLEADISWLGGSESVYRWDDADYETGIDALATLRARLGFTVDNVLFYGTAGLAGASLNYDWYEDEGEFTWNSDDWAFGYAVGAGVEYAIDDSISFKAEYLFTAVEGDTAYMSGPYLGDEEFPFDLSATASLFRAGVNFKF